MTSHTEAPKTIHEAAQRGEIKWIEEALKENRELLEAMVSETIRVPKEKWDPEKGEGEDSSKEIESEAGLPEMPESVRDDSDDSDDEDSLPKEPKIERDSTRDEDSDDEENPLASSKGPREPIPIGEEDFAPAKHLIEAYLARPYRKISTFNKLFSPQTGFSKKDFMALSITDCRPLHEAVCNRDLETVKFLVAQGAQLNALVTQTLIIMGFVPQCGPAPMIFISKISPRGIADNLKYEEISEYLASVGAPSIFKQAHDFSSLM